MAKSTVSAWAVLAVLTDLASGAAPPVVLNKPTEYPHAGVSLASPKGFKPRSLSDPYDVMNAVVLEGDRPVQSVKLSAFPVGEGVTAEQFAAARMAELKKNLAIRQLKPIKTVPISVAGIKGIAGTMTYTFRGMNSIAAQVHFIRDVKSAKIRICYLLTVECLLERQAQLLPTLGAVIKSVELTSVRHPDVSAPLEPGEPVQDFELGYSIRQPRRWYAVKSAIGTEMGQVDYLLGGEPMPSARLLVRPVSGEGTTSEAVAKQCLNVARTVAVKRKQTCDVTSEGPASLAGLPAWQFVLLHSSKKQPALPGGTNSPESVAIVQRTVCVAAGEGKPSKAYMLTLTARGEDAKAAEALMTALAGGFSLIGPATQPATAPTTKPTTRPAAKPPATAPATRKAAKAATP
ncbi:MAG: hypothetical protein WBF17_06840 [Phycisphaerae bacterium]